jgi:hypothetical protein
MSAAETPEQTTHPVPAPAETGATPPAAARKASDQPIPVWPDGVLAMLAAGTLLAIAYRHRGYLERQCNAARRAVEEFQRHGGIDDLTAVTRQVADFARGVLGGEERRS